MATIYLSFNNGGAFPNAVGIVAICFCAAFVLRTTLADRPFDGYTRRLAIPLVAFALMALLELVSAARSHAPFRALDFYDRTFLYVLVFALFGSLARTGSRLAWLIRGLAGAMSLVCLAGLVTRTLPHVWPTTSGFYSDRLSYPLGYWNALGMMGAIACIFLLHLSSSLREPRPIRLIAAALFPGVATAALLTYSRGALGVAILGVLIYAVLGRPRGLLSGLLAVAPATAVALHSGYDALLLSSSGPTSPGAVAQGRHVAVTVGICMLVGALIRGAALPLDLWLARPRAVPKFVSRIPRGPAIAGAATIAVLVFVLTGGPSVVSRQVHQFASASSGPSHTLTRERLADAGGSGRILLWRVALEQFRHYPALGEGAGTYDTFHAQHRTDTDTVTDSHSLYLQTLGEDGLIGLVLLVVVLVSILAVLAMRMRGPRRSLYAALFAAAVAWGIHGAADWDWQMPAVTLWLFAVGGLALAAERVPGRRPLPSINRTAMAVGWMVLAVAPLLIGFSYGRLRESGISFVNGNCAQARRQALSSMSLLAVRPQAYAILGYCDLQQGYPAEALAAMRKAVSYDRQAWDYHYGLAIALAANELNPIPEARQAVALNALDTLPQGAVQEFRTSNPRDWPRVAQVVLLQGLQSRELTVSTL